MIMMLYVIKSDWSIMHQSTLILSAVDDKKILLTLVVTFQRQILIVAMKASLTLIFMVAFSLTVLVFWNSFLIISDIWYLSFLHAVHSLPLNIMRLSLCWLDVGQHVHSLIFLFLFWESLKLFYLSQLRCNNESPAQHFFIHYSRS